MSKYIKQDDVFELVRKGVLISNGNFESVCKHIGSLPTIEVSEDCISREYILSQAFASNEYNRETKAFDLPVVSVEDIEDAPSVVPSCQKNRQVERAEGEWVHIAGSGYRCSNCNEYTKSEKPFHKPKGNCPNCGAKMRFK